MENNIEKRRYKTRKWCSVPQCDFKGNCSLFQFPTKKIPLKKWINACKIDKNITSNMRVCAAYFSESDFRSD